jgi:hypothetical protein
MSRIRPTPKLKPIPKAEKQQYEANWNAVDLEIINYIRETFPWLRNPHLLFTTNETAQDMGGQQGFNNRYKDHSIWEKKRGLQRPVLKSNQKPPPMKKTVSGVNNEGL